MISSFRCYITLIVLTLVAGLTLLTSTVCGERRTLDDSDGLPLSIESVTGGTSQRHKTSVHWKDREYDLDSGVDVLMSVVQDPKESAHERELALIQLALLKTQLNGSACLDKLGAMYDEAEVLEKQLILTCFLGSRDPRAIPVFVRTLDKEQSMKLQLAAASGLAGWNVRRGVAELVDLLDSKEVLSQPARMPHVRDNALESFRKANGRKGWGFPDEEIGKSIEGRTDLNGHEKGALYIAEVKRWFAQNEDRFPDWKQGDALPAVTVRETNKSTGE